MSPYEPDQYWILRWPDGSMRTRYVLRFRVSSSPDSEHWQCVVFSGLSLNGRPKQTRFPKDPTYVGYERIA